MSGLFDVNSLDVGVVNTVPANQPYIGTTTTPAVSQATPTGVVAAAANQGTGLVGGMRVCAALEYPEEYLIVVPATKIDGVTATTGTITVSIQWYDKTGAAVGSAVSYGPYTLAGGGEQPITLFPPLGADRFQATHTLSGGAGAYGSYTAGVVLGVKRLNRAF